MLLVLPIWSKSSCELGTIEKIINDNYLDTNYGIDNFFGKNLIFNIKKEKFDEANNLIITTGHGIDTYSTLGNMMYGNLTGINLDILNITPKFFKENLKEIENLGFKVKIDESYIDHVIRSDQHEEGRTKFQKLFGLNKFKK